MATITIPAGVKFRNARWTPIIPQQVNRSAWTRKATTMRLPGAAGWAVEAELVTMIGDAQVRAARSFLAKLRGFENDFLMTAVEKTPQINYNPRAGWIGFVQPFGGATAPGNQIVNGATAGWVAGARSSGAFGNGSGVTAKADQLNKGIIFGLTDAPGASASAAYVKYGWLFGDTGTLTIIESGTPVTSYGSYTTSTQPTVRVNASNNIEYVLAGSVVRTVTIGSAISWFLGVSLNQASGSLTLVPNILAAGLTQITASGAPGSDATIKDGMMATLRTNSGDQLVTIVADTTFDANGVGTLTFEPELRGALTELTFIEMILPYARVKLTGAMPTIAVEPGQIYSTAISTESI